MKNEFAWANLVYDDASLAIALGLQLRSVSSKPFLFCIVGEIQQDQLRALKKTGGTIVNLNPVPLLNPGEANYRYRLTMSKLNMFGLSDYRYVGIIDSDILFLKHNVDSCIPFDNLRRGGNFGAVYASQADGSSSFNAGVMFARTSISTTYHLIDFYKHCARNTKLKLPDENVLNNYWNSDDPLVFDVSSDLNTLSLGSFSDSTAIYHFADKKPWVNQHREYFECSQKGRQLLSEWDNLVKTTAAFVEDMGLSPECLNQITTHRSIKYFLDKQEAHQKSYSGNSPS